MKSMTILHYLLENRNHPTHYCALKFKKNNVWHKFNWQNYFAYCEKIASAFLALGLKTHDKVAILSQTRPEWELLDLACLGCNAITVPIYPSHRPDELEYILNDAQVKILICEDPEQYAKWKQIKDNCPSIEKVVLIEGHLKTKMAMRWEDFLNKGETFLKKNVDAFAKNCNDVDIEDIASIIYTSGTTGNPKGVVLTHRQIMSEVTDLLCPSRVPISSYLSQFHKEINKSSDPTAKIF